MGSAAKKVLAYNIRSLSLGNVNSYLVEGKDVIHGAKANNYLQIDRYRGRRRKRIS